MNFRSIYFVCKENYEIINEEKYKDIRYLRSTGKEDFVHAMENLYEIEPVREMSKRIVDNLESHDLGIDADNEIEDLIGLLKINLATAIKLYESIGSNVKKHFAIDIRFPETNNITEFRKYIDELEFIFTKCPFLQSDNESFRFEGVDLGSTWMRLSVEIATAVMAGSLLLNNVAAFIDKCLIIRSHYLTLQQQKTFVERDEIEQQKRELILEYIDSIYERQIDQAIEEMEEVSGHEIADGDEKGRAEQYFEKMERLLDKGLQIYSSIDSPQETKVLFEPLEMKYLSIAEEMKRLTEKKDEKEIGGQE